MVEEEADKSWSKMKLGNCSFGLKLLSFLVERREMKHDWSWTTNLMTMTFWPLNFVTLNSSSLSNYRITGQLRWGGDLFRSCSPTPLLKWGYLEQPVLDCGQSDFDWDLNSINSEGNLFHYLATSNIKKKTKKQKNQTVYSCVQMEFLVF